jgi:hypothetical protein
LSDGAALGGKFPALRRGNPLELIGLDFGSGPHSYAATMNTRFAVVALWVVAGGAMGCSGMEPIPGGFPDDARVHNAGQLRLSSTALAKLTADPGALLTAVLGSSGLRFDLPASCDGVPTVCCVGGVPAASCGPLVLDLGAQPGDAPRLEIVPEEGQAALSVVLRARMRTEREVPVDLLGLACGLVIDTEAGASPDLEVRARISFEQDPALSTTRLQVSDVTFALAPEDIDFAGGALCDALDGGVDLLVGILGRTLGDPLGDAMTASACLTCPGGDVSECSAVADSCIAGLCMSEGRCVQQLGIAGRIRAGELFGATGSAGTLDLYQVAGGYADTDDGGVSLGIFSGILSAAMPRDRCGPPAVPPSTTSAPRSAFFDGNSRVDTGEPFDLAVGLHQRQLEHLAYAAYESGLLCLTVTHDDVELLTTDLLALIMPSLGKLAPSAPLAVGIRPQHPPTLELGENRISKGGQIVEPLLTVGFEDLELDFFALVDDQYIRVFTLATDLRLPLALQVNASGIGPTLGELETSGFEVKNSEALTENPTLLAAVFPTLLELIVPQLGGSLGTFPLPSVGGFSVEVTAITAVEQRSFLGLFANLQVPGAVAQVNTHATLARLEQPPSSEFLQPERWTEANRPRAVLELGGDQVDLQWSVRVDGGTWSPWTGQRQRTISPRSFWIAGKHKIEVVARRAGEPLSADPTPVVIELSLGPAPTTTQLRADAGAGFHGEGGSSCSCGTASPALGDGVILILTMLLLGGRLRRRVWWALGLSSLWLGCGDNLSPCGKDGCEPGEVARGPLGRWNGIATDGTRTVVSTYDQGLGDLVLVEVAGDGSLSYRAIDGVPDETPRFDPGGYRQGIAGAGPDVGAHSSLAMMGGLVRIAYQDVEQQALRFGLEAGAGGSAQFSSYIVDDSAPAGDDLSLVIAQDGSPAIAYVAHADPGGAVVGSELRLARASVAAPGPGDWTVSTIAEAPGSCFEVCPAGAVCVESTAAGGPEQCVVPTTDCGGCAGSEVCAQGICRQVVAAPSQLATGQFVTLLALPDGRLAAVHYDRSRTALILSRETAPSSSEFDEIVLDDQGDRGMWASAVVDAAGIIHVVYQDAVSDILLYTSWSSAGQSAVETVDDGVRQGDRAHPVGAAAALLFADGGVAVAYQDGLTADLMLARRGATWVRSPLATGPLLDGFQTVAAGTESASVLAWRSFDPHGAPLASLRIQRLP